MEKLGTPGIGPASMVRALFSSSCGKGACMSFPTTFCALHSSSGRSIISSKFILRFFSGGASSPNSPSAGGGAASGISGFPARSIIFPLYDFLSVLFSPVTGSCRATDSEILVRLYIGRMLVVGRGNNGTYAKSLVLTLLNLRMYEKRGAPTLLAQQGQGMDICFFQGLFQCLDAH